ncbi:hypothetical protein [Pseudosulfitobacter koreensis]|uniref:Uncharacterized protein n=1 Tax=Pseudosulfitobacter koreensis TaxID=2968472 RepID=A0ABT1Z4I1_9RHOB|nr:hypothetical protein [Pseudosulfitobacter koreense]MCR8828049.1 hypothetical protein [Pseudosulfitobacter koreense]
MSNQTEPKTLDELAVDAVRFGREVAEAAKAMHLGGNAKDAAFVARALSRLHDRQPLHDADAGGLIAVREILEADIAREVASHETRFFPTDYDECGPIGETREVPIYTERGEELIKLKGMFEQFSDVRAALFDHLAAHQLLITKLDRL